MLANHAVEILGTVFFALAVLHTFLTKHILNFSHRFPAGSGWEALFHFLGEIEVVFGIWSAVFFILSLSLVGSEEVTKYVEEMRFTEPVFVFVVMLIASTKPIVEAAQEIISLLGQIFHKIFHVSEVLAEITVVLILGPLSGSLITEPAAMTVSALLLLKILDKPGLRLMYFTLAVLFVNVSIGGALTHFAAPPILMVAHTWAWGTETIFRQFGWKCILAVSLNTAMFVLIFRKNILVSCQPLRKALSREKRQSKAPRWTVCAHILFLILAVLCSHQIHILFGLFLFFLGMIAVTKQHQNQLRLRESLLVAFFLGGIIAFGGFQKWWLQPLLTRLNDLTLYFSSVALTSVTDNAALTYLGSQVRGLSEASKYYLVAGSIAGGGLTIIANAPNAAGFSILRSKFAGGLNPIYLFLAAIPPTLVAVFLLELLPNI